MKQYFTELEAAEAAGISLDTIKEFISLGVLKLYPADSVFAQNYLTRSDLIASFHNLKDLEVTVEISKSSASSTHTPTSEQLYQPEQSIQESEIKQSSTSTTARSVGTDSGSTFIEHRSFELLDLNKSLREQIEILKQERDWLRKRVETFEIRSERDQLLLMSETKTVQSLLPHLQENQQKKNFWSFALPWLSPKNH